MALHQDAREIYITGLKNAHAMESEALAILRPQARRNESYPEIAARLGRHIEETERQMDRLTRILDRLGADNSPLKDAVLSAMGSLAALGHAAAPDEILKNGFANFAFENYEIAAYTSLLVLARAVGDTEALALLEASLAEEEAMAAFLESQIEPVTLRYAALREMGAEAKS